MRIFCIVLSFLILTTNANMPDISGVTSSFKVSKSLKGCNIVSDK